MKKILTEIPILETENYQLKGISLEDTPSLFDFLSDLDIMKYITPHPVQTLVDVEEKIKEQLANFHNEKEIPWVIIQKSSQEVIEIFRLHKLNMWHKKAEMGAVIKKQHQQKGVMTELLKVVLPYGFNVLGLNRIVGDIFAENKRSKTLLEKFRFHLDEILRQTDFDGEQYHDTVSYSMLRSEFSDKTSKFF